MRRLWNLLVSIPAFIRRLPKRLARRRPQPTPEAPLAEKAVEAPPMAEAPPAEEKPPVEAAEKPPVEGAAETPAVAEAPPAEKKTPVAKPPAKKRGRPRRRRS